MWVRWIELFQPDCQLSSDYFLGRPLSLRLLACGDEVIELVSDAEDVIWRDYLSASTQRDHKETDRKFGIH